MNLIKYCDNVKAEKTNSSYGNWAVRTSNAEIKFFFKKKEAQKFADSWNNLQNHKINIS